MPSNVLTTHVDTNVNTHIYQMVDNYIYFYHTDTFIVIPSFADSVTDTMSASFATSTPLSRSAPIFSYQSSGPRRIEVQFDLHRDMMTQINYNISDTTVEIGDDYTDTLIKCIQAAVLPEYDSSAKLVNPPMVALRLGSDIFIKGVVNGNVSITYKYPVLDNGKYSNVTLAFGVSEVDPYSASDVMKVGSYRGLSTSLERKIWKYSNSGSFVGNMKG